MKPLFEIELALFSDEISPMKLHKTCQTDLWGNFSCSRVYLAFSQRALSSHGTRGACIKTQTIVLTAGRIEARSKRRRSI